MTKRAKKPSASPVKTAKRWGHDELANDLAAHLAANNDRMIWTNMQMGPSGSPRPDVYTVPKRYSKFTPLAYECKISVSDFRSDVTSGKWQTYLKYASGVIFAVPEGLITKADLPPTCGLIVRHANVWRAAKAPTLARVETLPHEAWMKLMIDGLDRTAARHRARDMNEWKAQEVVRKRWGDKLASLFRDVAHAEYNLESERKRLRDETAKVSDQIADIRRSQEHTGKLERQEIARAWDELATTLGVDGGGNKWAVRNALMTTLEDVSAAAEVKRATDALKRAGDAINAAMEKSSRVRVAKLKNSVEAAA